MEKKNVSIYVVLKIENNLNRVCMRLRHKKEKVAIYDFQKIFKQPNSLIFCFIKNY
jgi:hypothetical protein